VNDDRPDLEWLRADPTEEFITHFISTIGEFEFGIDVKVDLRLPDYLVSPLCSVITPSADLVQIFNGLSRRGPSLVPQCVRTLARGVYLKTPR